MFHASDHSFEMYIICKTRQKFTFASVKHHFAVKINIFRLHVKLEYFAFTLISEGWPKTNRQFKIRGKTVFSRHNTPMLQNAC